MLCSDFDLIFDVDFDFGDDDVVDGVGEGYLSRWAMRYLDRVMINCDRNVQKFIIMTVLNLILSHERHAHIILYIMKSQCFQTYSLQSAS